MSQQWIIGEPWEQLQKNTFSLGSPKWVHVRRKSVDANVRTSSPSFCAREGKTGASIAPSAASQVPCASLFSPCFFLCSWLWVLASVSATGSKLFFAVFSPVPSLSIFFSRFFFWKVLLALLVPLGQGRCDAFSLSPPPVTSFLFAVSLSGFACCSVICFLFFF